MLSLKCPWYFGTTYKLAFLYNDCSPNEYSLYYCGRNTSSANVYHKNVFFTHINIPTICIATLPHNKLYQHTPGDTPTNPNNTTSLHKRARALHSNSTTKRYKKFPSKKSKPETHSSQQHMGPLEKGTSTPPHSGVLRMDRNPSKSIPKTPAASFHSRHPERGERAQCDLERAIRMFIGVHGTKSEDLELGYCWKWLS